MGMEGEPGQVLASQAGHCSDWPRDFLRLTPMGLKTPVPLPLRVFTLLTVLQKYIYVGQARRSDSYLFIYFYDSHFKHRKGIGNEVKTNCWVSLWNLQYVCLHMFLWALCPSVLPCYKSGHPWLGTRSTCAALWGYCWHLVGWAVFVGWSITQEVGPLWHRMPVTATFRPHTTAHNVPVREGWRDMWDPGDFYFTALQTHRNGHCRQSP